MIDLKDALFVLKNKNEINKFLLDILTTKERKDCYQEPRERRHRN